LPNLLSCKKNIAFYYRPPQITLFAKKWVLIYLYIFILSRVNKRKKSENVIFFAKPQINIQIFDHFFGFKNVIWRDKNVIFVTKMKDLKKIFTFSSQFLHISLFN